jgi:ribose transport system substrate-binding protein
VMRWRRLAAVAALVCAPTLGGCSSAQQSAPSTPAASGSGGTSAVNAAVSAAQQPLAWQLSGAQALTVGTAEHGRKVAVVTKDTNPFIQAIVGGIAAAAGASGMSTLRSDPATSAADVAQQVSQAVSEHAAALITVGFTTDEIAAPLQQAHAAGIPVVQLFVTDPGAPPASATAAGVFAYVSPCYTCIGRAMADIVIKDSGGHGQAAFIGAPDVGIAVLEANGFTQEIKQRCPGCSAKVYDAPIADWGTQIPSIATAVAANPGIGYVVPVFDTASPLIIPSLEAADAAGRVKLVSSNGDQAQLQQMKSGATPRWAGDVGVDGAWIGWASMDEVYRALTGKPALADEKIGYRSFTPADVASLNLSAPATSWYGTADFTAGYLRLWGLS